MQNEKPRIHVKTKNLQLVFDYCIETKTEFTVIPKHSNDDWEIELSIRNILDAVKWGMFLKANKIDLIDTQVLINPSINKPVQPLSNQKMKKEKQTKVKSSEQISYSSAIEMPLRENTDKLENTESNSDVVLDFTDSSNNTNELF